MSYTSFIYPNARIQLEDIAKYLEEKRKGFGFLFLKEFNEVLDFLEKHGHAPSKKYKEYRQILIGRFRVIAVYELTENQIHIYNIIHTSRNTSKRYKKK